MDAYVNISKNSFCFLAIDAVDDVFFAALFVHKKLLFFKNKLNHWKTSSYHRKKKDFYSSQDQGEVIEKTHFRIFLFGNGEIGEYKYGEEYGS